MRLFALTALAASFVSACDDEMLAPPASVEDREVSTAEDTPVTFTIEASGFTSLTFEPPLHGTAVLVGQAFTYTPAADYHGADEIVVTAWNGDDAVTAAVAITVTAVNDAPVAHADAVAANEDEPATIASAALLANDTDVDGDELTISGVSAATHGTVSLEAGAGGIVFTPALDYVGEASFEYTVTDGTASATAMVTVTVGGVNDAPVAVADSATTAEDTPLVIAAATLTANDTDAEGQTLTVESVDGAMHGMVALAGDGTITFTPAADYAGEAGFDYTVSDGAATATAHVTVTVTPVNDAPTAMAAVASTDEDTAVDIVLTGSDIEGDALTFSIESGPTAGALGPITVLSPTTVRVRYTPNENATGSDAFTFAVSDGSESASAMVAIQIASVNDAPNALPIMGSTNEDTAVTLTLAGTDIDGDSLTFAIASGPAHGTLGPVTALTPTTASVVYTPAANYHGADSFTFTVADGHATSSASPVALTVTSVNDAPTAAAATASTDEDQAVTIDLQGADLDGDTLTFAIASGPTHGTLGPITVVSPTLARVVYTPAANTNGADGFTFTVSDGTAVSAPAAVSISVASVNDAPTATGSAVATDEDTAVVIALAGADVDGDALTFSIVSGPAHGTLAPVVPTSGTTATVRYTPAANYYGADSFTFRTSDGTASSAAATVTITVNSVNDAPTAYPGNSSLAEDSSSNTLMSGSDPEGSALTFAIVTPPSQGTLGTIVSISPTLAIVSYTPHANYFGPDSYTYTVSDGTLTSAPATNVITVTPVNDAPTVSSQSVNVDQGASVVVTLTGADIDSSSLSFSVTSGPAHGTLGPITSLSGTSASVTYTPAAGYNGSDAFQFRASDGSANSAAATVSISVQAVVCGDGFITGSEECDDGSNAPGDGCSAMCTIEAGYSCFGAPSTCSTTCGDGIAAGDEECDDDNAEDDDGCTTKCVVGALCDAAAPGLAGASAFLVDPDTGHCYAAFTGQVAYTAATASCVAANGHLATLTSATEGEFVDGVRGVASMWIGADDRATEGTFAWSTGEPFAYAPFQSGQPDNGAGAGEEDCVIVSGPNGTWMDTSCDGGLSNGYLCEISPEPCGDGVVQSGESCDDGNATDGDGCSATCQTETVYISEYIEGGSSNSASQAIEIYNPANVPRTVSCLLRVYGSNNTIVFNQLGIITTIAAHGTYTACNAGFNPSFIGRCNRTFSGINFSGDDLIELNCGGVTVDSIGQRGFTQNGTQSWGTSPTSTQDATLRRKCSVHRGDTDMLDAFDPATEWNGYPVDTFDDLGSHTCP